MPRYRGTEEGTASLVGRLLILIAAGKETSATLAEKLGISPRQVNRYVHQLGAAGWRIERHGARRHGAAPFELKSPRIILPAQDHPRQRAPTDVGPKPWRACHQAGTPWGGKQMGSSGGNGQAPDDHFFQTGNSSPIEPAVSFGRLSRGRTWPGCSSSGSPAHVDEKGRACRRRLPGARRIRERSRKWYGEFRDVEGVARRIPLATDKAASQAMLNEIVRKVERKQAGLYDPYEEHGKRPLSDHLQDYRVYLRSKGDTEKHIDQTIRRIRALFDGCGFRRLADLDATRVAAWLAEQRKRANGSRPRPATSTRTSPRRSAPGCRSTTGSPGTPSRRSGD